MFASLYIICRNFLFVIIKLVKIYRLFTLTKQEKDLQCITSDVAKDVSFFILILIQSKVCMSKIL